jgi:hypothetical protein
MSLDPSELELDKLELLDDGSLELPELLELEDPEPMA